MGCPLQVGKICPTSMGIWTVFFVISLIVLPDLLTLLNPDLDFQYLNLVVLSLFPEWLRIFLLLCCHRLLLGCQLVLHQDLELLPKRLQTLRLLSFSFLLRISLDLVLGPILEIESHGGETDSPSEEGTGLCGIRCRFVQLKE